VICEYLEDVFPNNSPSLLPVDPYDRAICRLWTEFVSAKVVPSFYRFLLFQNLDRIESVRTAFLNTLKAFAAGMNSTGPFFMGERLALVDVAMAPFAMRLWVFCDFKGGLGIPDVGMGGEDEAKWTRWRMWLIAIRDRKSIRDTMGEREHYRTLYRQ
jgi:glutathione S-transferase